MDDLVVKVGADITGFLSKIDAAKAKVNQLTEEQGQLKAVINDLNTSLRLNERELTTATVKLQKLNVTTAHGRKAAADLRKEIAQLALNSKTLSTSLTSAKTNLATTTGQLRASAVELKRAQVATGGFASGVKTAFSGLRSLANFIPGIGLAGIFGLAIEAVMALADKTKIAREAMKEYVEEMGKAAASAQTEVTSIKSLISIAQNENLSRKARTGAIQELQKQYPEYLANINLENINSAAASLAIDSLTASIARKAKAQGLANLATKKEEELFKLQNQDLSENLDMWDAINALIKSGGDKAKTGAKLVVKAEENKAAAIFQTQLALAKLNSELFELTKEQAISGDFSKFLPDPAKVGKSSKALETIADILAKMRGSLAVLSKEEDFFNIDKSLEKIKLVQGVVTKLFEQFKLETTDPRILSLDFEFGIAERGEIRKELQKIVPKEVAVPITLTLAPSTAVIPVFQQLTGQVLPEVEKLNQQIAATLESGLEGALSGVGEAIGTAIAEGGDIGAAIFGTIFQTLGSALQSLGKVAIEVGIGIKAIKAAFKTLNPIVAIAAGIAMIAVGALIKNSVGKIGGFATGGPVTGPGTRTSDSILARLSKGEFVISADAVSKFGPAFFELLNRGFMPRGMATGGSVGSNSIGGGQLITVQVEGNLRGRDIHISNKRTGIMLGRNG